MGYLTIIGIEEHKGNYQGHDFHNYNLHLSSPFLPDRGQGVRVCTEKVPARCMDFVPQLGDNVIVYYNSYQKVDLVVRA